jgi:hypothetical protein
MWRLAKVMAGAKAVARAKAKVKGEPRPKPRPLLIITITIVTTIVSVAALVKHSVEIDHSLGALVRTHIRVAELGKPLARLPTVCGQSDEKISTTMPTSDVQDEGAPTVQEGGARSAKSTSISEA